MNTEIKEILDELMEFHKTRNASKHLKKINEQIGEKDVYVFGGKLLLWHKLVFLDLELPNKYDLSDHEVLQERFKEFFTLCPSINKVFKLEVDYITWADDISEEEQEEIRNYIHENHKVQVRIRRNKI